MATTHVRASAAQRHGTTTWSRKASKIAVPPKARLAVIMLGMFGAVGEADFDNVAVDVTVAK